MQVVSRFICAALVLVGVSTVHAGNVPGQQNPPPAPGVQVGQQGTSQTEDQPSDKRSKKAVRGVKPIDWDRLGIARSKTAHGDKLLKKGDFKRAEEMFRKAIAQEAQYPVAYLGLGAALVGQQRFPEALDALHESEDKYLAWRDRVQEAALTVRKMTAETQQALRDILPKLQAQAQSGSAEAQQRAMVSLQRAYVAMNRAQSTGQISARIYDHPEDLLHIPAQVFYLEGVSYLRMGYRDKGVELLEVCLLLDDKHALAHYNLAVALFTRGDLESSKTHLDAAVANGLEPPKQFVRDLNLALSTRTGAVRTDPGTAPLPVEQIHGPGAG